MTTLRYTVPVRPVGQNHGSIPLRGGGRAKGPEAKVFAAALAAYGSRAVRASRWTTVEPPGQVDVLITIWRPDRRLDADAPVKAILDSLQATKYHRVAAHRRLGAGVVVNDRQVRDYLVRPRLDPTNPRIEITVGLAGTVFEVEELPRSSDHHDDQAFPTILGGGPA